MVIQVMTSKRHTSLYDFLLTAIMILFSGSASMQASKVTIDADGGADYTTLDAVLAAIEANSIDPDTIEFIGND
jgi:hypothetical protein